MEAHTSGLFSVRWMKPIVCFSKMPSGFSNVPCLCTHVSHLSAVPCRACYAGLVPAWRTCSQVQPAAPVSK